MRIIVWAIVLFYSILFSVAYHCNHTKLGLFDPYGVGVVARRNFRKGDIIEHPLVISIEHSFIKKTILSEYSMTKGRGSSEIVFGFGMMYNHHDISSIGIYFENTSYHVVAEKDIEAGEEMFMSYGQEWFRKRHISPRTPSTIVKSLPGCPYSLTRQVGHTLQATQVIKAGETIEVVRAIMIPAVRTLYTSLDPFVWYRETSTLGAMILLGNGPFYQAAPHPSKANVHYQWHTESPNHDQPLTCQEHMLLAFVARKDIQPGEVLTVPLHVEPISTSEGYRKRIFDVLLPQHCF